MHGVGGAKLARLHHGRAEGGNDYEHHKGIRP
jgi:hypothetical protein